MFGDNKPHDVGLIKDQGSGFGMCLRGSFPAFVVRLSNDGVARNNVRKERARRQKRHC